MKVFVTGGNGFIGSVVVRALLARNYRVRCLVRSRSRTERIDGLPIERVQGDVRDAAAVQAGIDRCAATIHLASPSSWNDIMSPTLNEVIEGGTRHVLQAAARQPGHRVVFVSSITAVNGSLTPQVFNEDSPFALDDPDLRYAHAKRRAEQLCRDAFRQGVPVVIVNPAEVYGPNDTALVTAGNLVDFARATPVLVCAGGTSIVHVNDAAAGIVAALEKGRAGDRYILGGENLTIREIAQLCLQLIGRRALIVRVPSGLLRAITRVAVKLNLSLPYHSGVIPYATRYWFVDGSKARRDLGVDFRGAHDTLSSTIAWLKQEGHIA